jgi:hypothetical protein
MNALAATILQPPEAAADAASIAAAHEQHLSSAYLCQMRYGRQLHKLISSATHAVAASNSTIAWRRRRRRCRQVVRVYTMDCRLVCVEYQHK